MIGTALGPDHDERPELPVPAMALRDHGRAAQQGNYYEYRVGLEQDVRLMRELVMTSALGSIFFGLWCVMGIFHAYLVVRMWTNQERADKIVDAAIASTPDRQRAIARAVIPLNMFMWILVLPYPFLWSKCGADLCGGDVEWVFEQNIGLTLIYLGLAVLSGLLFLMVMFFGWPRFLVPPLLRSGRSYWFDWREERASARRENRERRRRRGRG